MAARHLARRARGFTLIELLVALVLMAIMSGLAWRGLDGMLRSREITQQAIERSATLQTALAQWEQDWEQIQDSGQSVPPQAFDGARLRLTRRNPQGLQVVTWFVDQGRLCRWAAPPVTGLAALRGAWDRGEQALTLASERVVVLEGIADWQLHYFWDNAWASALSTGGLATAANAPAQAAESASAPASAASEVPRIDNPIPRGVRLQLQFAEGSGLQGQLTRQLLISGAGP